MSNIRDIASVLQKEWSAYHFEVYHGLFGKYIAVDVNGMILFTIWIDKNSGYKEVLDEVGFYRINLLKRIFKTRLFHWTKYRRLWHRDYPRMIAEKLELSSKKRKHIREQLELTLQNMHLTNHAI